MTTIDDLEMRIEGAEDALTFVKDQLAGLKTHLQELKEQEKDKEPESLFGRWATAPNGQRVLIVEHEWDEDGLIAVFGPTHAGSRETEKIVVSRSQITLDPVTLTTAQDFQDAPEGTIVEASMYPKDVAVKTEDGWYRTGGMHAIAVEYMPTCRVIRWGNEQ